jgi:hypothetical protein
MKKLLYIIIVSIAVLPFNSCKKELTENNQSQVDPKNFFKTDNDAIQGVNGAYYWLVGEYPQRLFQQELWSYLDEECDATWATYAGNGEYNLTPSNFGYAQTMWNGCYRGVNTACEVIDRVPQSGSSPVKEQVVAEARFLKSLYYYYLSGIFRDVPIITENNYNKIEETRSLHRTPAVDVRKMMIEDLNKAIAVLPVKYTNPADKGRATKGAAQTLLTKVYLWNKDWTNALTTAKAITGYNLLNNYADVFSANNEFNDESIFEINFVKDLLNSYQHGFYSPDASVGVAPFNSKPWYRLYVPYESFANSFTANDDRKQSIIATGYNGQAFKPDAAQKIDVWYGPKWWRLDADERNSGLDIYVFRYADVLLMVAEAANETGDLNTAYNAINQVRRRAKLSELSGLTQDQLRLAIRQERSWELVGEGHRKFDLVRWGVWAETAKAATATQLPVRSVSYQKKYEYLPIPAGETSKNPNLLPQNEGY